MAAFVERITPDDPPEGEPGRPVYRMHPVTFHGVTGTGGVMSATRGGPADCGDQRTQGPLVDSDQDPGDEREGAIDGFQEKSHVNSMWKTPGRFKFVPLETP